MCKDTTNTPIMQAMPQTFLLPSVKSHGFRASFTSRDVSSYGGLALLSQAEREIHFLQSLSKCINDRRNPSLIHHTMLEMITQRVMQIAAGFEDCDDSDCLRQDSMMKLSTGRLPEDPALASQPTMSRLENGRELGELIRMAKLFVRHFVSSYKKPPIRIVLDCDDSNANTYGQQEGTLFNEYYGEYCYMPLFIFEGDSGKIILPLLRPGRVSKRTDIARLLRLLITFLRRFWPETLIIVRGDAQFCSHEFMDWANSQHKIAYITGLTGNSKLLEKVDSFVKQVRTDYFKSKVEQKQYTEFYYKASSWKIPHRVIAKVEMSSKGQNIRFVVTNFINVDAKSLYENTYCKRGNCERYIKELKTYLFADRMSCSKFLANQFRLFLHAAAYVLILYTQQEMMKDTDFECASICTFRERLLLSAVFITQKKTFVSIEFSNSHPNQADIERVLKRAVS